MLDPVLESALWNSTFLLLLVALIALYQNEWWAAWQITFFATLACVPIAAQISIRAVAAFGIMLVCAFLTAQTALFAIPPWRR